MSDGPSGRRILGGRFTLEEAIGSGATGTVYRALDAETGARVAVKCLKSVDAEDVARFRRESSILGELDHPAIVNAFGAGITPLGEAFFAMRWLDGETLRERLRRSELTLEETFALAARVAAGLAHAHARGVVHRDVKPANVFLPAGDAATAVLLDFGIARRVEAGDTLTRQGQIVGTPGYVSPEQVQGGSADARSDVYSLGCLLFRCLAGRGPFEESDVLELLVRVTREAAPPLASIRPDLPSALAALVDAALAREPVDRPADAGELLARLEPIAAQTLEAPASRGQRPQRIELRSAADAAKLTPSLERAPAPASARVAPESRARFAAVGGLVLATLVGLPLLVGEGSRSAALEQASSAVAREAPPPPSVDAPAPTAPAISEASRAVWGQIRLGARNAAIRRLGRDVASGRASASQHLWLALLVGPSEDSKRNQREAAARQHELTPFEREVLAASGTLFAAKPDFAAAEARLRALAAQARAPELWLALARLRTQMNDRRGAEAALDAAVADGGPGWAVAASVDRLYVDWEFFDTPGAERQAEACVKTQEDAVDCLAMQVKLDSLAGRCASMEARARAWHAADPDDPDAFKALAQALAAQGADDEAIREALDQRWALLPADKRDEERVGDTLLLDAMRGRFDKALSAARALERSIPVNAPLLTRLGGSFEVILLASETDDQALVGEVSDRVLARASAANPTTATEAAYFLLFVGAARVLEKTRPDWKALRDQTFARYEAYLHDQGDYLRPYQRLMPWVVGYAAGAHTPEHLREAFEALPRYGTLPPPGTRQDDIELVTGTVLAANGRVDDGLGYLRRAAGSCGVLENPFAVFRARKELARVLAEAGRRDEARAPAAAVVAAWGAAKPPSRTARAAAAVLASLDKPR